MRADGTTARGYGRQHQKEREHWAPLVEVGGIQCRAERCVMPSRMIHPDTPWDLGHNAQRTGWTGPEHRRCNRRAGAINSNVTGNPGARRRHRRQRTVRHQDISVDVADL